MRIPSRPAALFLVAVGIAVAGLLWGPREAQGEPREDAYGQGLGLLAGGKWAEAEAAFTRALEADPALYEAHWERGRARLRLGNLPGAREDLDRWIEFDPKYALCRADLDLQLFEDSRMRRRDEEEEAGHRAEGSGNWLSAFRHYALAHALSREQEGEDRLAEALIRVWTKPRVRPGYPTALRRYLAQAQALVQRERHEEAAAVYRQAARFCPWCAEAHYNLALILGEYRRYPEAIRAMKRAQALLPEGPEAEEASGALITWELVAP